MSTTRLEVTASSTLRPSEVRSSYDLVQVIPYFDCRCVEGGPDSLPAAT